MILNKVKNIILNNSSKGQSLIEVVIALVVIVSAILMASTVMIFLTKNNSEDIKKQTSNFINDSLSKKIITLTEKNWDDFFSDSDPLKKYTINGSFQKEVSSTPYVVKDTSIFNSYFLIKDGDDNLSKKIEVVSTYTKDGQVVVNTSTFYTTRNNYQSVGQTDWQGGQINSITPINNTTTTYKEGSVNIDNSQVGSIKLKLN